MPAKSAIIYRNFIDGAGARAIGVGYPEKVSLAFDANDLRLALLWQGAFMDAARHWTDRGVGYEQPLGDNVLKLPAGVPFAVLADEKAAWPTAPAKEQGFRFRGYRLSEDDRPTFLYQFTGVEVEDLPQAVAGKDAQQGGSFRRTFHLKAGQTVDRLYYRAAVGKKIASAGDGWYRVDSWTTRVEGGGKPIVRESAGQMELLVPVPFPGGQAQLTQQYVW
jgi:hypothetical protein